MNGRPGHTGHGGGASPTPSPRWRETVQRPALWVAAVTRHGLRRAGELPTGLSGRYILATRQGPGAVPSPETLRLNLASVPRAHALQQRSYHS